MTIGSRKSVLDADRHHRAGIGRLARGVGARRVDLLLPAQHVVVAELEDVVGHIHALAVALAQVHVDDDAGHRGLLSSTMRSASSSGMASATCSVCAEVAGCSPTPDR